MNTPDGDSNSILNQKAILSKYAERPSFKKMIQDIEDGKVKTVVVKDMLRLGRDYLKVGCFSEIFFPDNDVRLN